MTVYKTRADLVRLGHPDFAHLDVDTSGNPCVWRNHYRRQYSDTHVEYWASDWSCQCDDDDVEPCESEWLPTGGDKAWRLWKSLPEA
jgi:hypothetical protein